MIMCNLLELKQLYGEIIKYFRLQTAGNVTLCLQPLPGENANVNFSDRTTLLAQAPRAEEEQELISRSVISL